MSSNGKNETIHRKKFADGQKSPEEVHREIVYAGALCDGCGSPRVAAAFRVLAPVEEFTERNPTAAAVMALQHGGGLPVVATKFGKFVKLTETHACDLCLKDAERAAARCPSWCLVEIDQGPGETKPQVQVG